MTIAYKSLIGYTSELSTVPGAALDFMVSSQNPFDASIVRLQHEPSDSESQGFSAEAVANLGSYPAGGTNPESRFKDPHPSATRIVMPAIILYLCVGLSNQARQGPATGSRMLGRRARIWPLCEFHGTYTSCWTHGRNR